MGVYYSLDTPNNALYTPLNMLNYSLLTIVT